MPRTPVPTAVADRTGAAAHDPQRFEGALEADGPLGDHPADFTPAQARVWVELVAGAVPGVLTSSDRFIVEQVCMLMAELRETSAKFSPQKHGRLTTCLANLGMTPSGRRSVSAPKGNAGARSRSKDGKPKATFDDF